MLMGMMQRELAAKLNGFTTQNVSQIEVGRRPGITLDLACRIALALDTTLDRLVGMKEELSATKKHKPLDAEQIDYV